MKLKLPCPRIVYCILFSFFFLQLKAQTVELHGRVIDSTTQQPVPGATVSSNKQKVLSDPEGNFTINADKGSTLTVSFIGFGTQAVTINNDGFLTIQLSTTSQQLTDIVVTALGIRKETKRLGYSVQEVKGSDLLKARESNPINGLAGKVAGLNVGINQELLGSPTVLLRGSPLNFYVVDGIPVNSDTWNISTDDIENFYSFERPYSGSFIWQPWY